MTTPTPLLPRRFLIELPAWAQALRLDNEYRSDEAKVELAIELSRRNIDEGDGGPFGAAVFQDDRLIAIGMNQVLPQNSSIAHAEMVAFMLAQHGLGRPRLNDDGGIYTLATSAQPCCQCYGACFWAGIDTLLIGASAQDVMELTPFDEGPLPADWQGELEQRAIVVKTGIARDAAREVLANYGHRDDVGY